MKKRLLSLLMTLALCLSLVPFAAVPAGAEWSGDGSKDNPYQIGSAEQLAKFRDIFNGTGGEEQNDKACALLTADIDLGGIDSEGKGIEGKEWTPMGKNESLAYLGVFDGGGHTVSGLYVDLSGDVLYAGLFGYIGKDETNTGTVQDLIVAGTVTLNTTADGNVCLGGVAGLNGGTIQCVSWSGSVTGTRETGDNGDFDGGGVTGRNDGTVSRCRALGKVGLGYSGDSVFHTRAGGVVGYNAQKALLEDSFSDGAVFANRANTTSGKALAGGVVGSNEGTVQRGYHFRGEVTAKYENNHNNNDNNAVAGGVAGFGGGSPDSLTACYWLKGTAGIGIREGQGQATELTTEQFRDQSSFDGSWFTGDDARWTMGPKRPELLCFVKTVTTWEACWDAMQKDCMVVLGADLSPEPDVDRISDNRPLTVPEGGSVVLDLAGHTIDRNLTEFAMPNGCVLRAEGELTVIDSSDEIGRAHV